MVESLITGVMKYSIGRREGQLESMRVRLEPTHLSVAIIEYYDE
jgi:hypothetical protein